MSVLKVIEILASSTKSWEDAAANAVAEASKTIRCIRSIYIKEQNATVENGKIVDYRINAKITFSIQKAEKVEKKEMKVLKPAKKKK